MENMKNTPFQCCHRRLNSFSDFFEEIKKKVLDKINKKLT